MTTTIKLPVPNQGEGRLVVETLEVHDRGEGIYELAASPGLIEGLAGGDEITLDATRPEGYQLVRRGGNVCVWFYFPEQDQADGDEARELIRGSTQLGGRLDGRGAYSLVFTIPVKAGFAAIEALFNRVADGIPGATWMFGNVYDVADGKTPLNWW